MPILKISSEEEMKDLAARTARLAQPGDVFLLEGPLGVGKSVFARGFIQGLCGTDTEVPSPTFTLVQTYDAPAATLWHFDLYRIEDPEQIFELGWEDAMADGISLIEWPSRLGPYMPVQAKRITIDVESDTVRKVSMP